MGDGGFPTLLFFDRRHFGAVMRVSPDRLVDSTFLRGVPPHQRHIDALDGARLQLAHQRKLRSFRFGHDHHAAGFLV